MKQTIFLMLFICFPMLIQAADLPTVVNRNRAANLQMCIDRAAADCINTICINSSDINCTDNCQSAGQDKCKLMIAE